MKQGDIITVAFPFSDLSEKKLRPAVVISNNRYNHHKNVILLGVYGKKTMNSLPLLNSELTRQKMIKESHISLQNMFSAEKVTMGKTIDSLTSNALQKLLQKVHVCF
ncbi:type II toxin-antitoxin system PemK/MazF family toxin [bacterium]|nr:type II toxin-antitoxin system PemK/MazF family toxin [bacterium]